MYLTPKEAWKRERESRSGQRGRARQCFVVSGCLWLALVWCEALVNWRSQPVGLPNMSEKGYYHPKLVSLCRYQSLHRVCVAYILVIAILSDGHRFFLLVESLAPVFVCVIFRWNGHNFYTHSFVQLWARWRKRRIDARGCIYIKSPCDQLASSLFLSILQLAKRWSFKVYQQVLEMKDGGFRCGERSSSTWSRQWIELLFWGALTVVQFTSLALLPAVTLT